MSFLQLYMVFVIITESGGWWLSTGKKKQYTKCHYFTMFIINLGIEVVEVVMTELNVRELKC